jgi:hypothetical protein
MYFAARRIISSPRSIYNTTSFPILHDVDGDGGSRSQTDDSRCRPLVDEYFWFTSSDNMQVANNACRVTGVTRRERVLQGRRAHRNISEPFACSIVTPLQVAHAIDVIIIWRFGIVAKAEDVSTMLSTTWYCTVSGASLNTW